MELLTQVEVDQKPRGNLANSALCLMLMLAKFTYDTQAWFHGWSKQCLSSHLSLAWGSKALSCDAVTPWRHVEKVGGFGPGCGSYLPRRRAMNCGLSRWSLTFPKYPKLIKRLNIGVGTSKRSRAEATQKCPPFWPPFFQGKNGKPWWPK